MFGLTRHQQRNRLTLFLLLLLSFSAALVPFALAQRDRPEPAPGPEFGTGNMPAGPLGPRSRMLRRGFRGARRGVPAGPRRLGPVGRGGLLGALNRPDVQRELALTEDQRKKLDDVAFNANKARIQEQANLQVHRLELARLMRADNPDRAAIDKKLQDISQAQLALSRATTNAVLDGRGVLTKQQRDKLAELARGGLEERTQREPAQRAPRQAAPSGAAPQGRGQPTQPPSQPPAPRPPAM